MAAHALRIPGMKKTTTWMYDALCVLLREKDQLWFMVDITIVNGDYNGL